MLFDLVLYSILDMDTLVSEQVFIFLSTKKKSLYIQKKFKSLIIERNENVNLKFYIRIEEIFL